MTLPTRGLSIEKQLLEHQLYEKVLSRASDRGYDSVADYVVALCRHDLELDDEALRKLKSLLALVKAA